MQLPLSYCTQLLGERSVGAICQTLHIQHFLIWNRKQIKYRGASISRSRRGGRGGVGRVNGQITTKLKSQHAVDGDAIAELSKQLLDG